MAGKMIEWEKLFNSLNAIVTTDQVEDSQQQNLSMLLVQRRLKSGLQRSVKRVNAIMSAQVQSDEAYRELTQRLQALALPVTVERLQSGGRVITKKGVIVYGE